MGVVSDKKRNLILPAESKSKAWPKGWKFPGPPWPPGWPRSEHLSVSLDIEFAPLSDKANRLLFTCNVRDDFKELTDELDGEMVFISAHVHGEMVRMREAEGDETWSKNVLLQIGSDKNQCGVQAVLDIEPRAVYSIVTFSVGIYGLEGTSRTFELEV
jgi:hypothetical protein